MKEHNESNKSEEAPTQETQVVEIEKRLDHIEELLNEVKEAQKRSQVQWTYSIGFGAVAIGAGMVIAGTSAVSTHLIVLVGAFVLFAGIAIMVLSPMGLIKRKPAKKVILKQ